MPPGGILSSLGTRRLAQGLLVPEPKAQPPEHTYDSARISQLISRHERLAAIHKRYVDPGGAVSARTASDLPTDRIHTLDVWGPPSLGPSQQMGWRDERHIKRVQRVRAFRRVTEENPACPVHLSARDRLQAAASAHPPGAAEAIAARQARLAGEAARLLALGQYKAELQQGTRADHTTTASAAAAVGGATPPLEAAAGGLADGPASGGMIAWAPRRMQREETAAVLVMSIYPDPGIAADVAGEEDEERAQAITKAATAFNERHRHHSAGARGVITAINRPRHPHPTYVAADTALRFEGSLNELRRNRLWLDLDQRLAVPPGGQSAQAASRPPLVRLQRAPTVRWSLEGSIWLPRKQTGNTGDFFETRVALEQLILVDWSVAASSHGLSNHIIKKDQEFGAEADEDGNATHDAIDAVVRVLSTRAHLVYGIFDYFAALGDEDRDDDGEVRACAIEPIGICAPRMAHDACLPLLASTWPRAAPCRWACIRSNSTRGSSCAARAASFTRSGARPPSSSLYGCK